MDVTSSYQTTLPKMSLVQGQQGKTRTRVYSVMFTVTIMYIATKLL